MNQDTINEIVELFFMFSIPGLIILWITALYQNLWTDGKGAFHPYGGADGTFRFSRISLIIWTFFLLFPGFNTLALIAICLGWALLALVNIIRFLDRLGVGEKIERAYEWLKLPAFKK